MSPMDQKRSLPPRGKLGHLAPNPNLMPRSRDLKGIAAGLATSFVSRNNDIEGYWGVGVLCRAAAASRCDVVLDILGRAASPDAKSCARAAKNASQHLDILLEKAGFAVTALTAAQIRLEFGGVSSTHHQFDYRCTVLLTDTRGRQHVFQTSGRCWPHDPARESCSGRGRERTAVGWLRRK